MEADWSTTLRLLFSLGQGGCHSGLEGSHAFFLQQSWPACVQHPVSSPLLLSLLPAYFAPDSDLSLAGNTNWISVKFSCPVAPESWKNQCIGLLMHCPDSFWMNFFMLPVVGSVGGWQLQLSALKESCLVRDRDPSGGSLPLWGMGNLHPLTG